jgi:protein-S-isoprenylcysteine O-methyltransferase Ste14
MLKLPPPLWGLLFLTALYFLSDLPALHDLPVWRNKPAGIVIIVLGLLPAILAMARFFSVGTQIEPTSKSNNKLVADGPYRFTRNPMYLGLVVASFGGALWFGRPLMFLAPVLLFLITNFLFIPFEEAKMRRQFGAEFDAYTQKVRRWL